MGEDRFVALIASVALLLFLLPRVWPYAAARQRAFFIAAALVLGAGLLWALAMVAVWLATGAPG